MTTPCAGDWATFDAEDEASQARAVAICAGCPARDACRDGAVERDEQAGCWGGEIFPRPLLLGMPAVPEVAHGTRTRRNAGCACDRCRLAHTLYVREWRAGRAVVTDPQDSISGEQLAFEIGA